MPLPKPEPGLVLRFDYLWMNEDAQGRDQGKTRPSCLVAANLSIRPGKVLLLPITHTPPTKGVVGIEIPWAVKRSIGFDDARSWVIVSECNLDQWPNSGLSPIHGKAGEYSYGYLPPKFFSRIRKKILEFYRSGNVTVLRQ